jgi:uncharacterized metal-binding protein
MNGDFPTTQELYGDREDLLALSRTAAIIEGEGYRRWTRGEEIVELARRLGMQRVGLAACQDMDPEVDTYARWLEDEGLQAIRARDGCDGHRCAPREQAIFLNRSGSGLNLLMGMCVGHDGLFMRASQVPVTAFIARDTFLRHNPVAALHTRTTYFEGPLHTAHREAKAEAGLGPEALRQAAENPFCPAADQLDELADQVLADGAGRWCRVEELIEFAARAGARTLGLIFCSGLREEARALYHVLEINGFRVLSLQCKSGAVPKEELGILDSQKVRPGNPEMMCNPLAQAKVLNDHGTDLNVVMGQCTGHDTASIALSGPLTVSLVVKDRVLAHNTVAELYYRAAHQI